MYTWRMLGNNAALEDKGTITNEELLPIREAYSPNSFEAERYFKLDIGPLECTEGIILTYIFYRVHLCLNLHLSYDGVN